MRVIPLVIEKEKLERARQAAGPEPLLKLLPLRPKTYGLVTTGNEVFHGCIQDTFTPVIQEKLEEYGCTMSAHVAGIMAAKRTGELIPLCHRLNLTGTEVTFRLLPENCSIEAVCTVRCDGKTGVEMEALTGVSAALLTVYDMCKAADRGTVISDIHLLEKHGGKSGDFYFEETKP